MNVRVLVVQPDASAPLCAFEPWLAEAGVETRTLHAYDGEPIPAEVDADGLIVLGGDMSALDDDAYPWLAQIRALMCRAHENRLPSLGICLGGQLMARAFGGTVTVGNAGLEAGVVDLAWRDAAAGDPIFAALPTPFPSAAMHGDMVAELPPGSVWLAESSPYPHQAFRVGTTSWGVQFHPEIDLATYDKWVAMDDGTNAERLRRGHDDFAAVENAVLDANRLIAQGFARVVQEAVRG